MCVCVLEILVLKIFRLRDYFKRLLCWLDHWLSCMLNCIHICVFLLSKNCFEKLARHLLDTSQYLRCRVLLKVLFKPPSWSVSHFFDLSRFVRACSSPKHSLFHSQPLPQGFFKLFHFFSTLSKLLIPFYSCISCFKN